MLNKNSPTVEGDYETIPLSKAQVKKLLGSKLWIAYNLTDPSCLAEVKTLAPAAHHQQIKRCCDCEHYLTFPETIMLVIQNNTWTAVVHKVDKERFIELIRSKQ